MELEQEELIKEMGKEAYGQENYKKIMSDVKASV